MLRNNFQQWDINKDDDLNSRLFNNELPPASSGGFFGNKNAVKIKLVGNLTSNGRPAMGSFTCSGIADKNDNTKILSITPGTSTINLNSAYANKRTEKDWTNTLLHEMIHAYNYIIQKENGGKNHTKNFMNLVRKFGSMGYDVSIEAEIPDINAQNLDNSWQNVSKNPAKEIVNNATFGFYWIETNIKGCEQALIPYTSKVMKDIVYSTIKNNMKVKAISYFDITDKFARNMMDAFDKGHSNTWSVNNGREMIFGWYGSDYNTILNNCYTTIYGYCSKFMKKQYMLNQNQFTKLVNNSWSGTE